MERNKAKRGIVILAASVFLAAASGPSYSACWGTCESTASPSSRSMGVLSSTRPQAPYQGTWGSDLAKAKSLAPRHQSELVAHGTAWGADWGSEFGAEGHAATPGSPASRTN
jgi:hypothetical protein